MSGRVSIVSVALLVTTLGWPTVAASQPRTTPEVNAICVKEVRTRAAYHLTPEPRAAVLRRVGASCCQELSAKAAKLSPLQRGLVWATLDNAIGLMTKRGDYRATQDAIAQFRAQLTLPQADAARALIVDQERCYRRAGG